MEYQCLIVDDEKPLADSTAEYFNLLGVSTAAVYDGESCLAFLRENRVSLILLDINLGDSSGFELCCELRRTMKLPILFISARQSDDDILLALGIGGDDYIRKPYTLSILLAKVKAVLRRCGELEKEACEKRRGIEADGMAGGEKEGSGRCVCGRLTVDFGAGRAFLDDSPLKLKAMEYKLLCYLIRNRGRVVPKEELFAGVWEDRLTGDGTLNVHIRRLREQIEEDPNNPVYIQTVWGRGYLFCDEKRMRI